MFTQGTPSCRICRTSARDVTRAMIPESRQEVLLENPLIMLVDQRLAEVDDMRPALELAAQSTPRRPLLVIAVKIDDLERHGAYR